MATAAFVLGADPLAAQSVRTPTDFFGFEIGTDGELARYPAVLEYMRHLADQSDRVRYEVRGTTTNGHPYALVTISSPKNLVRLNRLIEINHRLSDPRGLSENDAQMLARVCPTGMIFVPSRDGISHNPAEYTAPDELEAGANVLLDVMLELAKT